MPIPVEYQQPREAFVAFLADVRDACELGSTHQAYTTAQAVLRTFRRRLSLADAIRFAGVLPGLLRALFVADWDPDQDRVPFGARATLEAEVRALRPLHNFSPSTALDAVRWALWRHVDAAALATVLQRLGPEAVAFWHLDRSDAAHVEERAAAWRALGPNCN